MTNPHVPLGKGPVARVLVTRALHQSPELADALRACGLEPVIIPVLEMAPPVSFAGLDDALARLKEFDWLLFTSANAVQVFRQRFPGELPSTLHVAVIGSVTARAAQQASIPVTLQPEKATGEGLADALLPHADGARMLLVRAAVARDVLPGVLQQAGARVEIAEAYRTVVPAHAPMQLKELFIGQDRPSAVAFTSSSSVHHLLQALQAGGGELPELTVLATIGPITSATLREAGYIPTVEAKEANVASLAEAIASALGPQS
ncbi:uroporphyrinogen-III synthase [Terriglobus tenax]|uniref:uroporphyrinogen-III synthase n=1 Tax=Terriglobus tenax TaxID=1111115 RepID=UPI0021DFA47D|nr:uroporphyrinogen-III synthase [Terriglobus tenax]